MSTTNLKDMARAIRKAVGSSSSKDAGPSTLGGGFGSFDPWKKGILEGRQFDYMAAVIDDGNSWMAEPNIRMRTDSGSLSNPMRWANSIGGSKKEELVQWQRKLFAAGLYGGDEPIYGYYDRATAGALSSLSMEVLRHRNKYKPSEILDMLRQAVDTDGDGIPDGGGSGGRGGAVFDVTNPLDLRETAQSVSSQLMGREVDEAQADSLMGGYQGLETAPQSQADAIMRREGTGTVVRPPSAAAYAEQQLREQHGVEIDSYAALGAFNRIMQMAGLAG